MEIVLDIRHNDSINIAAIYPFGEDILWVVMLPIALMQLLIMTFESSYTNALRNPQPVTQSTMESGSGSLCFALAALTTLTYKTRASLECHTKHPT